MEYTKFAVYDHETQTMSEWYSVQVGHEGNFVYDKTTDSAKISIYTATKPAIKINQWAFVGHFADDVATTLTYDLNGLPINHEQYIVAKFEMQEQKNGKWLTKLALQEPIEAMRGVVTETLSFTNQTEKTVTEGGVDTTYTKNRYNCLTALERVLKVTPANNDITKSWWARIEILDYAFLSAIPFDDDTFTAGDLFTILFKFDDVVDRTPVIYFNMESLGAVKKYLLKFERKDGFDKTELDYDDLIADNIGLIESDTADTYATGVVSEVSNLATNNIIKFPSVNMWAVPQFDSEDREVPEGTGYKGQWYIKTPTNIKRINAIYKMSIQGTLAYNSALPEPYTTIGFERDVADTAISSKYILERQNYLASDLLVTEKDNLFWFEQGTDKLFVNEYFKDDAFPWTLPTMYYVEYEPLVDTALQYGDSEYQVQLNQTDSQIESLKYTKFLENYLKGMNKADVIFTKIYTDFDEFKDLVGSLVSGTDDYIISNVSYKNTNQGYVVAFQLNKSNLRRSANVKANEQIKSNKAIDYDNLKDRKSRFVDFIKIDTADTVTDGEYLTNKLLALSALIPTQISKDLCPQVALFRAKGTLTKSDNSTVTYSNEYLLNFAKIVNKNQIQYAIKTQDNAQIGTKKEATIFTGDLETVWNLSFGNVQKQLPILYTDAFGEVQKIDYIFSNVDAEVFNDYSQDDHTNAENVAEINRTLAMHEIMTNLPEVPSAYRDDLIANKAFEIDDINKYKDMLEIENDAFIFNVTSDNKNIIVCQPLLEYSRLIQPTDGHDVGVMVYGQKMAENDVFGDGFVPAVETYDGDKITLSFDTDFLPETAIKSIVIFSIGATQKPMLIINNPNEADIRNGFIKIYY